MRRARLKIIVVMALIFALAFLVAYAKGRLTNQVLLVSEAPALQTPGLPTADAKPTPKFNPTFRGCGPDGYSQGYELPDHQALIESNWCFATRGQARQHFQKLIRNAPQVLENLRSHRGKHFHFGPVQRIVVKSPDSGNATPVKIIYLNKECVVVLSAPTYELAQEFEKTDAWAY